MKVAQVVCVFRPYKGGIGEVAYYYGRELVKNNFEVSIFTPRYNILQNSREIVDGIYLRRNFPIFKFGNAAFLPQLIKQLLKFDIVHLHYPFYGSAEMVYLLKKLKKNNVKLIITYHMDVVGDGLKGKIFDIHTKKIMPEILKAADKIIVSSFDYIQNSNALELFSKFNNKFYEIPFGVDEVFEQNNTDRKEYDFSHKDKILLFVGGLDNAHYFKGLENLLKAVSQINDPNIKLIAVGKGDMQDYYKNKAKELQILDKVFFTGFVEDEDLVNLYNICDVFVLPSVDKSEAFGLVSLQAMACAKPVITSNLAGVRSVVKENINGLIVEPGSISDLKEKIIYLLQNSELRESFGKKGKAMIENKYNWKRIGEKIIDLYCN